MSKRTGEATAEAIETDAGLSARIAALEKSVEVVFGILRKMKSKLESMFRIDFDGDGKIGGARIGAMLVTACVALACTGLAGEYTPFTKWYDGSSQWGTFVVDSGGDGVCTLRVDRVEATALTATSGNLTNVTVNGATIGNGSTFSGTSSYATRFGVSAATGYFQVISTQLVFISISGAVTNVVIADLAH